MQYKILRTALIHLLYIVTNATFSPQSKGRLLFGFPYLPFCSISNFYSVKEEVLFSLVFASKKRCCLIMMNQSLGGTFTHLKIIPIVTDGRAHHLLLSIQ